VQELEKYIIYSAYAMQFCWVELLQFPSSTSSNSFIVCWP